jgi:hypothetical protein
MRKVALTGATIALVLALAGVVTVAAASQAAEPSHKAKTLTFDVVFSPFTPIAANNQRDPNSPFALGDEIIFHDQLFTGSKRVGDDLGSCVIVSITTRELAANCSMVIRLPGGNLTGQFVAIQGPAPREIALTGGTGRYRAAGGEGTLVEFGNGRGRMTLQVLRLVAQGKGA